MKFIYTALLFASIAVAIPSGEGVSNDVGNVKFPVDKKYTVRQAKSKCGNDADVSCCNKVIYTHDISDATSDRLADVIQTALSGGPGGDGLGLFSQCNPLSADVPVLNVVGGGVDQSVVDKCKQNVSCCQKNVPEANGNVVGVAIPCVALGSLI